MRILAAGDIHGDTGSAEKLAKKAEEENVDLVILCGDITHFEASTENIIGHFAKRNKKVLLIPGNHEGVATTDFLAELYGVKNIHGYSVKYNDVGIFGAGGSSVVGPSPIIGESEMLDLLEKGFERIKYLPKKIMVTHEHPKSSKMEKFTRFFPGSNVLKSAIEKFQPDIMLCSHVHEAEGIEEMIGNTKVINVGKAGKIIDL